MSRVDTDEGECSVSEAQRSSAPAEQVSEARLAAESPNRRKRRLKSRFSLTENLIAHVDDSTLCVTQKNASSNVNVF